MTIPFLPVDFVILAVLGLSGFFAAYRGFVNELLSILGWATAAIITAVLFGTIKSTVREIVEPDWFADIVGFVGLFLAVIIPISFIAYRVGEAARQSSIGPLDRSLGFVYGVVRGLAIAAVAYIIFDMLAPKKPEWIADAKLIPIVQRTGDVLTSLVHSKQPKGVQTSADPQAPPRSSSKPKWSTDPVPEQRVAVAEPPPAPPPPPRLDPPPPKAAAPKTAESPPPPASEVGGLAPFLQPEPAKPTAEPAKPKQQPKPAQRSQAADSAAPEPAKRETAAAKKPAKPSEKAKTRAKTSKPDAKQNAKRPAEKRAPKSQTAANERRPKSKPVEDKPATKGYGQRDRQALDQLVRSTTREP
jgi:membrane protein required for colicin V production